MTPVAASRRLSRSYPPPVLLALAYGALSLAWVVGNPAGSAPDEPGHYIKALGLASGEATGRRLGPPRPGAPRTEAWTGRTARAVDLPPGLAPAGLSCNAGRPEESAACQEAFAPPKTPSTAVTHLGTAQPTSYLVPGLLARLAGDAATGVRLGRLGSSALSVGLIVLAVALLWDRSLGPSSMVGLVAAVTPMVVFMASSLTASGAEITAGICFFAALLRVTRGPTSRPWPWVALGLSGAVLAASRSLGPAWVVLDLLVVLAVHGLRGIWALVRPAGRRAFLALAAVALAAVSSAAWEVAVQPHGPLGLTALKAAVRPSVNELRSVLGHLVGVFGALDSPMPVFAYVLWWAMLASLFGLALRSGRWRERVVLVLVVAGAVPLCLFVAVVNLAQTGFGMQGRYVLPVVVAAPLLAGEMLARARPGTGRSGAERLTAVAALVAGVVQAVAWYANARRSALGTDGSWLFAGSSEWSPPGGWYPLLALVGVAVVLVLLFSVASFRHAGQAAPRDGP